MKKSQEMHRLFVQYGGKCRLASKTTDILPDDMTGFIECCAGGGAVSMSIPDDVFEKLNYVGINDLDNSIYNLYATLKGADGKELFEKLCDLSCTDKWQFDRALWMRAHDYYNLSNVDKAVSFYIEVTQSFSSLRRAFRKGMVQERYTGLIKKNLPEVMKRLKKAEVTNRNALDIIEEHINDSEMCLYLDVPYRHECRGKGADKAYMVEMSIETQLELLELLQRCQCKVILCGYRNEYSVDLYDKYLTCYGFTAYRMATVSKICEKGKKSKADEIVWLNYDLPDGTEGMEKLESFYEYSK